MEVASLKNCKKLYELSGWKDDDMDWYGQNKDYLAPKYSLGYLIRKLPMKIASDSFMGLWLAIDALGTDGWQFSYRRGAAKPQMSTTADTPENACALLCIKLIEEGLL